MNDTESTIRLLEKAIEDARAAQAVGVEITLYDQDGGAYLYRWAPLQPGQEPLL